MRDELEQDSGDIMAGDRRLSRPDSSLPDWEMPDGAYRPIAIVWFTGAFFLQRIALFTILVAFIAKHGFFTIALSALITGLIGGWTWNRGMKNAGMGWKIATMAMLATQFLFVCLAVNDRL